MQLIRCTKKLQKEMGLKKSDLIDSESDSSLLGPWHANLLHIDRRKCVLFANDKTLFNFIVPDLKREHIRNLEDFFRRFLACVVGDEGMSESVQKSIAKEYQDIAYANTNNRQVLGSMNDLAFHYKHGILEEGGVHSAMVPEIIHQLNRMPMGARDYKYPVDLLKELYEDKKKRERLK